MKKRNLNIFDAGVAFLMAFVLAQITSVIGVLITQAIMQACGLTTSQISIFWDTAVGYLLQALYMNIGFIVVFVWFYTRRARQPLLQKPTKPTLKYVAYCVLLGISTLFLLAGVLNYFQLWMNKIGFSGGQLSYELDSVGKYFISLISLAVLPAICEELVFRGILTTSLKQKSPLFAVVISSIMFAIFHFSPSQLLYPLCFGLILGIVYLRTNNIIFPILLHFINNALSVSIQYFSSSSSTFIHTAGNLVYAILTFIVWIVIMFYLFKDFINHISTKNNEPSESEDDSIKESASDKKFNNIVLYGSIALMSLIYIILMI